MIVKKHNIQYENKVILSPMVRFGTLPMRLLALKYGADLVYTEELIDWKLIKSKRIKNDVLDTVDFVDPTDGNIIFRTCSLEKDKVILQIGTSEPSRALLAAKLVEEDVAGIDINMGCPKEFSVKGGMGVALLSNPEKAKSIVKALADEIKIPVTCKIRLLPDIQETINFVNGLSSAGVQAVAIHARTKTERPQHNPHPDAIKEIVNSVNIPIIANGGSRDIEKYSDILKFREACGSTSIMIGRAAQRNVSIFRKNGMLPMDDVIINYLKLCIDYDNSPSNTKYCIQNILREQQESPRGRKFLDSQTLEQICSIWDLGEYCRQKQLEYKYSGYSGRREVIPGKVLDTETTSNTAKRQKIESSNIIEQNIAFYRSNYPNDRDLPKSKLHLYATQNKIELPIYETERVDKLFRTIITFENKKYRNLYWEKNKKYAEQGAALVALLSLQLISEKCLIENGSILS